jgi:lipoprotein-anchoring transpeptidase ErfK/SrfK
MAKRIVVLLDSLKLQAYENDTLVYEFDHVPGDDDHKTPKGCHFINRKHKTYRSKTYNAQMDYAMFFTTTGEAIHQYHGGISIDMLKGLRSTFGSAVVGSHGCVRLDKENAEKLFNWAPMGTPVFVGTKTDVPTCPVPAPKKK